jgi:SAM-dependent methyltransferase
MHAIDSQFDEDRYLASNLDVKQAVGNGQFRSGLDHFLMYGHSENRTGVTVDPTAWALTCPQPPEYLRQRVHGARDLGGYLRLGLMIAEDLDRVMSEDSASIPRDARVLDFGSGPGRVTPWLCHRHPEWRVFATDIDAEAVVWARMHWGAIAQFDCNLSMPPLYYPDGYFDFVCAVSVFTHLPEDMQSEWLSELARVTRHGGYFVASTHGAHPFRLLMPKTGFYYQIGGGTNGMPGFYQNSYQTTDYVLREWQRHFSIEKIIPRGLARHQDLVICRK